MAVVIREKSTLPIFLRDSSSMQQDEAFRLSCPTGFPGSAPSLGNCGAMSSKHGSRVLAVSSNEDNEAVKTISLQHCCSCVAR